MEEYGVANLRFATASVLKSLQKDTMETICAKYPKMLGKTFSQYKLKIIKEQKSIPLDYVMVLPKKITRKIKKSTRNKLAKGNKYLPTIQTQWYALGYGHFEPGHQRTPEEDRAFNKLIDDTIPASEVTERMRRAFALENMLKNVAIRQIVKIREIKEKRSLKEAVKQILARQREEDAKKRRKLKKKLTREYEDCAAEFPDEKDGLFNRVIVGMDRLLKVLTSHSAAVDSLEKKLNDISAAKKKRGATAVQDLLSVKPLGSIPEDKMFNTGELEGFEAYDAEDNLDFIDKSDLDRD